MKTPVPLALALTLVVGLAGVATAADTTLTGSVMCAKCTLEKADANECQDVLVVKDAKGQAKEYYVAGKDGKTWVTATKMEEKKK